MNRTFPTKDVTCLMVRVCATSMSYISGKCRRYPCCKIHRPHYVVPLEEETEPSLRDILWLCLALWWLPVQTRVKFAQVLLCGTRCTPWR